MSQVQIPFVREMWFRYGRAEVMSPLVRRVVAENPGRFTLTGTTTHIVGRGEVAVIDPGPASGAQLQAILSATAGERISHIFVTHAHLDHSRLARRLAEITGARVYAGRRRVWGVHQLHRVDAGDDIDFQPDAVLADGQLFGGPGWTIEAVATPGHTADHFAFALRQENTLFPGDAVMGWSAGVVAAPDGDMGDFLASLERIRRRHFDVLLPSHGPPIRRVEAHVGACLAHHRALQAAIFDALADERVTVVRHLVGRLFPQARRSMDPAASQAVLAHLLDLHRQGRVDVWGEPGLCGIWRPALQEAA
jgi:glyoxylase-like metal-dependent hydrolase (beta-lactamase superfamily II)